MVLACRPHCGLYSMMALSIGSDSVFTVLPDFNFLGINSPKVITFSESIPQKL